MHRIQVLHPANNQHDGRWVRYHLPGSWDELTRHQLTDLVELDLQRLPREERRLKAFTRLIGLPDKDAIRLDPTDLIAPRTVTSDDGQQSQVEELLPWMHWSEEEPVYNTSLLPEIRVGRRKWTGPADGLCNFTVKRWAMVDENIMELHAKPSVVNLNNVLGALYVPEGDAWNSEGIDERGVLLAGIHQRVKYAALVNYKALRGTLPLKYPLSFQGAGTSDFGVHGMIVDLAGTTAFGGIKDDGSLRAYDAMLHDMLVHTERTQQRMKEKPQAA